MEDVFKNISQYQLFNFLLTGTVFCLIVSKTTGFDLRTDNVLFALLGYYFIGMIISRIGSILIAPMLKRIRFKGYRYLHREPYENYVRASMIDSDIKVFSQENNIYRTFIAGGVIYIITLLADIYGMNFINSNKTAVNLGLALAFTGIMILAYRKQTDFISKRIKHSSK